tara:strand:+ start:38970 stop:40127 length:1158 start_codon:yes stop_codon:yes gene_type:complete
MNVILFDVDPANYYPLSYTRPISNFRIGILTIKEKWQQYYKNVSVETQSFLKAKYIITIQKDNLWINSKVLPSEELLIEIKNLRKGELLEKNGEIIAFRNRLFDVKKLNYIESNANFITIENICDIFIYNDTEIKNDFKILTKNRKSAIVDNNNTIIGDNVFIENGANISCSILNSEQGPIYIGKNSQVMEGSIIKGPFSMLNNSVLKMGAKIYGATTLGPFCKVGGEVNNSVLFGYSSKAHDGFLGNSVIGEWCNLGAGTNISNLKNNYDEVRLWNYKLESFQNTNLQFCGLVMGDHSKTSINTMFNTGTVVGVNSNIYGSGFPRNFVPSFSWGGANGFKVFDIDKAFLVAEKVYLRRNIKFSTLDKKILHEVFNMTKCYRNSY